MVLVTVAMATEPSKTTVKYHGKKYYVHKVQEGDTLYKIAVRFYGSIKAWRMIRDANKAVISTDGRVQAGDTIRLP